MDSLARMSRRVAALEELAAITRDVIETVDLDRILGVALDRLTETLQAEGGAILLLEPDASLRFVIATGPGSDALVDQRVAPGQGIAGWVVKNNRPICVADVLKHPHFCPHPDKISGFTTRAVMACPLTVRGRTVGVVELVNKTTGKFTRDDRVFLEAVTYPIAAAIDNARARQSLAQSQDLIMEHSRTIEAKVWERTAELRAANRRYAEANRRLREARDQMVHAEKMASIGSIAAGVAHEINNPIGFVGSNLKTLRTYVKEIREFLASCRSGISAEEADRRWVEHDLDFVFDDLSRLLSESQDGVSRVVKIVRDLKEFSHADRGQLEEVDINECVQTALTLLGNELKYHAKVETYFSPLEPLECYAAQLNQVLVNLIINAVHALGDEQGRIAVRTRKVDSFVEIDVEDDGCGIPPEIMARIFDPFYTTKEVGKGTGLGLSISYEIMQRHLGDLRVRSAPNEGTTFTIRIPVDLGTRLANGEGRAPASQRAPQMAGGTA